MVGCRLFCIVEMSHFLRKPVCGVSSQVRAGCSAAQKLEPSDVQQDVLHYLSSKLQWPLSDCSIC